MTVRLEWRTIDQRSDGTKVRMPSYVDVEDPPEGPPRCGCCCHDEVGPCRECLCPRA